MVPGPLLERPLFSRVVSTPFDIVLGLYKVERYWQAVGLSGFKVYKFVLSRYTDQDPSPWLLSSLHTESQLINNEEYLCESDSSR